MKWPEWAVTLLVVIGLMCIGAAYFAGFNLSKASYDKGFEAGERI